MFFFIPNLQSEKYKIDLNKTHEMTAAINIPEIKKILSTRQLTKQQQKKSNDTGDEKNKTVSGNKKTSSENNNYSSKNNQAISENDKNSAKTTDGVIDLDGSFSFSFSFFHNRNDFTNVFFF